MAHMRVADLAGQRGKCRNRLPYVGRIGHRFVSRHGADRDRAAVDRNAGEVADAVEVDQIGVAGEAQFQGRDERHAAGEVAAIGGFADEIDGFVDAADAVVFEFVHRSLLPLRYDRIASAPARIDLTML